MSVVKREIFDHWKWTAFTERLSRLKVKGQPVDGRSALYYLARLWLHCEANHRGDTWPEATSIMVEGVTHWKGRPGDLFKLLVECKWVDELPDGGVRIHGWAEANGSLLRSWNAWAVHATRKKQPPTNSKPVVRQSPESLKSLLRDSRDRSGRALKTQWAAVNSAIVELEKEEQEEGHLTEQSSTRLRELKAKRNEIRQAQTGVP